MKKDDRYDVSSLTAAQFEPGSNKQVYRLGEIYEWTGAYRQVNISMGDLPFSAAARVPALMAEFEKAVLALQAGLLLPEFSVIAEEQKLVYFAAVQAGLDRDYQPMEQLFTEIIERSLASS